MSKERFDLTAIRARLDESRGQQFWRSLDELADTAEFREFLDREFPRDASEWRDPVSRRTFVKLMGASLALAGLTGCEFALKQPQEKIVPYVRQPEQVVPGKPLFFATAMPFQGYGIGLLVESHEGRPTKIEGNPDHPASLGASDKFMQASILTMYDPDRSQRVVSAGAPSTWDAFLKAASAALEQQRGTQGAGLRILTETLTSPTLVNQIQALLAAFPSAKWYQYEPTGRDSAMAGARLAFGQDVHALYRFDQAHVVVSLDADFMNNGPGNVRYARQFADSRRVRKGKAEMSRLYVAEVSLSPTGTLADHRLPVRASQVETLVRAIATGVGVAGVQASAGLSESQNTWVAAVVKDLQANRGASIVVAGDEQPAIVHALANAINFTLGNSGATVFYIASPVPNTASQLESITTLAGEMDAGQVQMLLMLGGNPVYDAPVDLNFGERLKKVPLSVHLSLYEDETSAVSSWHVNEAHYLEAWGDVRSDDGSVTIMQPLIAPLYGGKTATELLGAISGNTGLNAYNLLINYWRGQRSAPDFNRTWQIWLHNGIIDRTQLNTQRVTLAADGLAAAPTAAAEGLELVFRTDPSTWDGRFANNGWLLELPRPVSKLVWDNVAMVSPKTAEKLGVITDDVIELTFNGRSLRAPVWIAPGQAEESITLTLGYGRSNAGRVGNGIGYNAYALRTSTAPWSGGGVQVRKTGEKYKLVSTQLHFLMEGRKEDLVRSGTLAEFEKDEEFIHHYAGHGDVISLFPPHEYTGYAWGMTIDTNVCNGCGACVVACNAENNIPIVGKDQVSRGREMQWLRIDQYYVGSLDNPTIYTMPMLCQHCENAPCELVCPVAATMHDTEGLNVMVYNRCVGTKYCSNNCPYKVRRFNFLQYVDETTPSLKAGRNPDVTVRSRGVMEKCTYCIQRISEARIEAEKANRRIQDGEVITACQQTCPTQAIMFGDINDPNARVTKLKAEPLNYTSLDDLNNRPRTSYLARLHNLNAELGAEMKTE